MGYFFVMSVGFVLGFFVSALLAAGKNEPPLEEREWIPPPPASSVVHASWLQRLSGMRSSLLRGHMTPCEHAAHEAANRNNLESLKKDQLQEIVREILNILDSAVEPEWSAETIEHVAEVLTERNFLIRSPQDFEE